MLRVCIAKIQNVERSLLLLVVSASDIPLRTIEFFSVLFPSPYSSMLRAVTNIRRRLCDLHCMVVGNCFCHFVVRTSSNRSIASYWTRIAICAYTPPAFDAPVRGVPVGISPSCLAWKTIEWLGYPIVKTIRSSKISLFVLAQLTNVTDRRTDRQTDAA